MTTSPPAFVDTNILVRHLTGDPPDAAKRATRFLAESETLLLLDLIVAEVAYVLNSYYRFPRRQVAMALQAVLAFPAVRVTDADLLHRAIELFEVDRMGFADGYLVASAERSGNAVTASFDRTLDRPGTVRRLEPA